MVLPARPRDDKKQGNFTVLCKKGVMPLKKRIFMNERMIDDARKLALLYPGSCQGCGIRKIIYSKTSIQSTKIVIWYQLPDLFPNAG